MVEITITDGVARFEIEGLDKLWAFKSRLEIPLAHIRDTQTHAVLRVRYDISARGMSFTDERVTSLRG